MPSGVKAQLGQQGAPQLWHVHASNQRTVRPHQQVVMAFTSPPLCRKALPGLHGSAANSLIPGTNGSKTLMNGRPEIQPR